MMTTKVQKWGNSFAVRIPKDLIRRLALREGSDVAVREEREAIVIRRREPQGRPIGKNDWRRYMIPVKRKKENVSGAIDAILYDASH
ncbi:MAG: hypothetical protein G01um101433_932 [Parcubacteria group bacterium Gr01-1014_33]|nr:MAG: hypothetical protein G01um101433_932 [Parcubacteria group bacterium Gr01-1014_33]